MGANGCEWVLMGALGCRKGKEHKNKASRGHLWSCRPGFGRYGRGNFPEHDVFWRLPKMFKYGCRGVKMVEEGCNGAHVHGGERKQGKESPKWAIRASFCMYGQVQKIYHVGRDGHGDQGGSRRAM